LYNLVHRTLQYTEHCISYIHLLHLTLLFHMLVSLLHGCSITPNTVISYSCITIAWILLVYILISLLCRFTGIHALIVLVFVLPESLFLLHDLLLNEYSCIPVTCVFNIVYDHFLYHCVDMKLLLSRHTVY